MAELADKLLDIFYQNLYDLRVFNDWYKAFDTANHLYWKRYYDIGHQHHEVYKHLCNLSIFNTYFQ